MTGFGSGADDDSPLDPRQWRKWQRKVDTAMFGYQREEDNVFVDGLVQNMADLKHLIAIIVKVGIPLASISTLSVFLNMIHNYNVAEALGRFFKGLGW
jgi:hypothetical protein